MEPERKAYWGLDGTKDTNYSKFETIGNRLHNESMKVLYQDGLIISTVKELLKKYKTVFGKLTNKSKSLQDRYDNTVKLANEAIQFFENKTKPKPKDSKTAYVMKLKKNIDDTYKKIQNHISKIEKKYPNFRTDNSQYSKVSVELGKYFNGDSKAVKDYINAKIKHENSTLPMTITRGESDKSMEKRFRIGLYEKWRQNNPRPPTKRKPKPKPTKREIEGKWLKDMEAKIYHENYMEQMGQTQTREAKRLLKDIEYLIEKRKSKPKPKTKILHLNVSRCQIKTVKSQIRTGDRYIPSNVYAYMADDNNTNQFRKLAFVDSYDGQKYYNTSVLFEGIPSDNQIIKYVDNIKLWDEIKITKSNTTYHMAGGKCEGEKGLGKGPIERTINLKSKTKSKPKPEGNIYYVGVKGKKAGIINKNQIEKYKNKMNILKLVISKVSDELLRQNEESKIKIIGGPYQVEAMILTTEGKFDGDNYPKVYLQDDNLDNKDIEKMASMFYNKKFSNKLFMINRYPKEPEPGPECYKGRSNINYYFDEDNYKTLTNKAKTINKYLSDLGTLLKYNYKDCKNKQEYKDAVKYKNMIYGKDNTIRKLWKGIWKNLNHIVENPPSDGTMRTMDNDESKLQIKKLVDKTIVPKVKKTGNPWIDYVKKIQYEKGIPYTTAIKEAKKTYKPPESKVAGRVEIDNGGYTWNEWLDMKGKTSANKTWFKTRDTSASLGPKLRLKIMTMGTLVKRLKKEGDDARYESALEYFNQLKEWWKLGNEKSPTGAQRGWKLESSSYVPDVPKTTGPKKKVVKKVVKTQAKPKKGELTQKILDDIKKEYKRDVDGIINLDIDDVKNVKKTVEYDNKVLTVEFKTRKEFTYMSDDEPETDEYDAIRLELTDNGLEVGIGEMFKGKFVDTDTFLMSGYEF